MAQRILIVEDDTYIRELYDEVLKNAGYDVDTAENGLVALDKIKPGGYDLILLDVVMPKLDGWGVLEDLAAHPPDQKNGPIILLTNLSQDGMMEKARQKGAANFLIKSDLTPDQLLEGIKKFLIPASQ